MAISRIMASLCFIVVAGGASAERYIPNLESRLEALEQRLDRTARQPVNSSNASLSSIQVELSSIREEMRAIRGGVEEARFAADQLQREMKLSNEDHEYRFKSLEEKLAGTGAATSATDPFGDAPPATTPVTPAPPANTSMPSATPPIPAPVVTPVPATQPADIVPSDGAREHYNFAVGLIKEKNFDRARDSFKKFIATYPSHRLVGNAYYWLGETYYVQSNFNEAAQAFKSGFEHNADGIKAADNLYKLAKSLLNMDKQKEACLVLSQLQKRYKQRNPEVVGLAFETEKASGCQQ